MNRYQRIFGSGPLGSIVSVALLIAAAVARPHLAIPDLGIPAGVRSVVFATTALMTAVLVAWGLRSLSPIDRGRVLSTTGAFRYFRHPLYAAFLSSFNFGLAVFLDHLLFLAWALVVHVLWHWLIRGEEALIMEQFGESYLAYARRTGRFIPRFHAFRQRG